jgi:hypothetical protein
MWTVRRCDRGREETTSSGWRQSRQGGGNVGVDVGEDMTVVTVGDPAEYRALFDFAVGEDRRAAALDRFARWLRGKGLTGDLDRPGQRRWDGRELTFLERGDAFAGRLVELAGGPAGGWSVELTVHAPADGPGWCLLRARGDDSLLTDVSALAGDLLRAVPARDGAGPLTASPVPVGQDGVDDVIDAVCDPDRRGLVVVAGAGQDGADRAGAGRGGAGRAGAGRRGAAEGGAAAAFQNRVGAWSRQVWGLAQVMVLDAAATASFAEQVGATHAVPPWALRAYLPAADPASAQDARRHRVFGAGPQPGPRDAALPAQLGGAARAWAGARPLPAEVSALVRTLAGVGDRLVLESLTLPDAADPAAAPA